MKYFIFVSLTFISSAFCATVGEFPFHELAGSAIEENFNEESTTVDILSTELFEDVSLASELESNTTTEKQSAVWTPEPSPLLQVIRDFLVQARNGLLDPQGEILRSATEGPVNEKTEKLINFFERGIIEATTILRSRGENAVTVPTATDDGKSTDFLKRVGDVPQEPMEERINMNVLSNKNKRQTAFELIANMSTSCSDCYDTLQSCVQQCFVQSNCNDIQRNSRSCPLTPSRLCNPFTAWNPVDECQSKEDCKSPLLCCNDGCINKCVPGVWHS